MKTTARLTSELSKLIY